MTVLELRDALLEGRDLLLLDVREPEELSVASLPHSSHVPMGQIVARAGELDRDREIVVMCHHGVRSAMVVDFLRSQGFERVANLDGGIDAWSTQVDPGVPRY